MSVFQEFVDALKKEGKFDEMEMSALSEIGNIIAGSGICLGTVIIPLTIVITDRL